MPQERRESEHLPEQRRLLRGRAAFFVLFPFAILAGTGLLLCLIINIGGWLGIYQDTPACLLPLLVGMFVAWAAAASVESCADGYRADSQDGYGPFQGGAKWMTYLALGSIFYLPISILLFVHLHGDRVGPEIGGMGTLAGFYGMAFAVLCASLTRAMKETKQRQRGLDR